MGSEAIYMACVENSCERWAVNTSTREDNGKKIPKKVECRGLLSPSLFHLSIMNIDVGFE